MSRNVLCFILFYLNIMSIGCRIFDKAEPVVPVHAFGSDSLTAVKIDSLIKAERNLHWVRFHKRYKDSIQTFYKKRGTNDLLYADNQSELEGKPFRAFYFFNNELVKALFSIYDSKNKRREGEYYFYKQHLIYRKEKDLSLQNIDALIAESRRLQLKAGNL
jgi:hypothetical protein